MYADLLRAQARVLGAEHRDTLNTAMQLAGAALHPDPNPDPDPDPDPNSNPNPNPNPPNPNRLR